MTVEARYNLQRGIPEDKSKAGTAYTVDEPLDRYLLERQKILDSQKQQRLEEKIESLVVAFLEKEVEKVLGI